MTRRELLRGAAILIVMPAVSIRPAPFPTGGIVPPTAGSGRTTEPRLAVATSTERVITIWYDLPWSTFRQRRLA